METKLGLQLWSVRQALDEDFAGTLEKIAEIGYKDIQINSSQVTPRGLLFGKGVHASEVRKYLDRFGLRAVSAHFVPTPDMRLDAITEDMKVLGADTLACAIWFWSNRQEVVEFIHSFNQWAETLKKLGIQLYYHNHFHEFQVFGDKSIYEMMLEDFDKDLVMIEFDTYWAVRGGQDPIYWMKKLGKRADLIHQKDMPATTKPVILFEKFGYDANITIDTMWETQVASHFTEVGDGVLNIAGILDAMRKYNQAKYVFIEQDMSSNTEFESIAISLEKMTPLLATH